MPAELGTPGLDQMELGRWGGWKGTSGAYSPFSLVTQPYMLKGPGRSSKALLFYLFSYPQHLLCLSCGPPYANGKGFYCTAGDSGEK